MVSINRDVAVVMSVYKNDRADFLRKSIDSTLSQLESNLDFFIAVDGPVGNDISNVLDSYSFLDNVFIYHFEHNKGLAQRLNELFLIVFNEKKYSYIARMDADDICVPSRISKQVFFLENNLVVDVVGTDVIEIDENEQELFHKQMTSNFNLIKSELIKKCPLNHPSVMFRVSSLIESGCLYKAELKNTQDYYLWVDLIEKGLVISNINEPLLFFRIDNDFHKRRGLKKAQNDLKARIYAMNKLKCYSPLNVLYTFLLFILRLSPPIVKKLSYKLLR